MQFFSVFPSKFNKRQTISKCVNICNNLRTNKIGKKKKQLKKEMPYLYDAPQKSTHSIQHHKYMNIWSISMPAGIFCESAWMWIRMCISRNCTIVQSSMSYTIHFCYATQFHILPLEVSLRILSNSSHSFYVFLFLFSSLLCVQIEPKRESSLFSARKRRKRNRSCCKQKRNKTNCISIIHMTLDAQRWQWWRWHSNNNIQCFFFCQESTVKLKLWHV